MDGSNTVVSAPVATSATISKISLKPKRDRSRSRERGRDPNNNSDDNTGKRDRSRSRGRTRSLSPPVELETTLPAQKKKKTILRSRSDSDSIVLGELKTQAKICHLVLKNVVAAAVAVPGGRPYMEDRFVVVDSSERPNDYHFAGVYDGHGGQQAADYVQENLHKTLEKYVLMKKNEADKSDTTILEKEEKHLDHIKKSLRKSFLDTDDEFLKHAKEVGLRCGTTALVSLVQPGKNKDKVVMGTDAEYIPSTLIMAHIGDSRAVLCHGGHANRLTTDHKPDHPKERERVQRAGGLVTWMDCWRVHHERVPVALACARAFGDRPLKEPYKLLSADPDISSIELTPEDTFIILASDGVWDVVQDQVAVDIVRAEIQRCKPNMPRIDQTALRKEFVQKLAKNAAKNLVVRALNLSSTDNITAVVLYLDWDAA